MINLVLVPGTWANTDRDAPQDNWWLPGSPFWDWAQALGFKPYSFAWNTKLDGVIGPDTDWEKAAGRLVKQTHDLGPVSVVAHSHGGNVVAFAGARGMRVDKLVTVATPVRSDVPYDKLRPNVGWWTHIYGNFEDWVQLLGELAAFRFSILKRQMPLANANVNYPTGHSTLHDVSLWNQQNWWRFLK